MIARYGVEVSGVVQGVGYRPFVYHQATCAGLSGWVYNHAAGVSVEIQGEEELCRDFIRSLSQDAPALAVVEKVSWRQLEPVAERGFVIRQSQAGAYNTLVSPDMGICPDCLADIRNPADRHFRYPFTNCTNCGPRFTIIESLPYDRARTTMRHFPLCPECGDEYQDPADRRFHAQPNACPVCGPQLSFCAPDGAEVTGDPLTLAQAAIADGRIVAVKGLGGYHLVCDAANEAAVERLRRRKYRYDKPFAVMMADAEQARRYCWLDEGEEALLTSRRRPIVLLRKRREGPPLAAALAPGNSRLGVMLPYTPLHYLLIEGLGVLVMTSGNRSDEPIYFDDDQALAQLGMIADGFLRHNRPVFRRCDDSVTLFAMGGERLIRRSRGYAPQPLPLPGGGGKILACGGQQKNTFCLTRGEQAFLSQHIGDLENEATLDSFTREIADFEQMFNSQPQLLAHDLHPAYLSTKFALAQPAEIPRLGVQHHHAHLASVLAEHDHPGPVIGLIYDGTGLGTDGTIWGGEVLVGDCRSFRRAAHLLPLPLFGGEQAIREPWRAALATLVLSLGRERVAELAPAGLLAPGWELLLQAGEQGINAPLSSGMGRLFDAAAALAGIGRRVNYEGQAAVELEQVLDPAAEGGYPFTLSPEAADGLVMDWRPLVRELVGDVNQGLSAAVVAVRFHRAVVDVSLEVCRRLRRESGLNTAVLSGGCWQNVYLLENTCRRLAEDGFTVLLNSAVPCNDGGLAFGQAAVAAHWLAAGSETDNKTEEE